ncbi:MAG: ATP-binding protein [Anaerolineae bacterium]|nr:ATP-binding protein [Anaerolineae bacterium]
MSTSEAERRRLLNILLVGMAAITGATLVLTLGLWVKYGPLPHIVRLVHLTAAALAGFGVVYLINRYRSPLAAAILFVSMLFVALLLGDDAGELVYGRSTYMFVIPIFVASIILRPWAGFVMAALSWAAIGVLARQVLRSEVPMPTILGFFAVATISWLATRSREQAFRELQAVNRELDRRVEERTRSLAEALEWNTRLYRAATAIGAEISFDKALHTIAEQMALALGTNRCILSLWDQQQSCVEVAATFPEDATLRGTGRDHPTILRVLDRRRPLVLQKDGPAFIPADLELLRDYNAHTLLMLPLLAHDRVVGLVELVEDMARREYTSEEIQLAESLAAHAALALENARLYEQARKEIAERIMMEEALRKSEERYRTLVAQAPIGIVTCDREGNIIHVNPALLEILGSPGEEATRQFNLLTMPNLVQAGIAQAFRRCMEEGVQITSEHHYVSHWGKESIMRIHFAPLRDEHSTVNGALALVEDVTRQRKLEEQLIQSAKLASIGELAAGVAHEINNPINGIINYAQLLLNRAEPGSREARFLEGIIREGERVAEIVRDLLTFARADPDAGTSPAYVHDILKATLTLVGQQLEKDHILLEIEETPNLPPIRCRSQRIQQVFLNLISNARSALNERFPAADPNKKLTIRIEEVHKEGRRYVRTSFHDRGIGIPPQNLSHIFTPFFTTKRPGEGTGLGLSVSYGIVKDHGGVIEVESVEGEYAIFRVDLPIDRE